MAKDDKAGKGKGKGKSAKRVKSTAAVVPVRAAGKGLKPVDAKAEKLSGKDYDKALRDMHVELVKLQEWVKHAGLKVCIVFEGRDGAGKGGTIKAITERVSPRVFRVVALPAPTEREKSQMYLQRYLSHMPAAGEIVIFDRSWYNRAGVERVMGFASDEQVKRFLNAAPMVEKAFVESGSSCSSTGSK
jgi:polyphosphate kinase 2 (PPK2 family)